MQIVIYFDQENVLIWSTHIVFIVFHSFVLNIYEITATVQSYPKSEKNNFQILISHAKINP